MREGRDAADAVYLETWRDALAAMTQAVGHVGLLLHWYRGGLSTERIRIADRRVVPLSEISLDLLHSIREDVLYELRRRA